MDVQQVIEKLGLLPHPGEGGFFRETYRCAETVKSANLPHRYRRDKSFGTAIFYLITPESFSVLHRICSDEIFHFYLGDTAEMMQIHPDGKSEIVALGQNIMAGELPQVVVPSMVWQGLRLKDGGKFALLGTTVAPAFDYEDFEIADSQKIVSQFPKHRKLIDRYTKPTFF